MTKKIFLQFLKENLGNLSIEKQEIILKKISSWVEEYRNNIKKNYTYCDKCKKYHKTKDFEQLHDIHTEIVTTYTDCGYGDDDRYGEVEFSFTYSTCPGCGYKKEINRYPLRTLWEKTRT